MPAKKWQQPTGVMREVIAHPQRFQFMQAVRLLLRCLREDGITAEQALSEVLRFQNSLTLAFPPSDIEALLPVPGTNTTPRQLIVTPAFIGLLGVNGSLPLHHTERIATQEWQERDAGARAFLDIFSHRLVAQFFLAWSKYRFDYQRDVRGSDALAPLLAALAGTGGHAGQAHDGAIANYAALLRNRPISAVAIERVLSEHFAVPVRLEQFHGCWDTIPEVRRSVLGGPNPRLAFGAALGIRVWRHDLRPCLKLGPLNDEEFQRLLPHGQAAHALARLLARFGTTQQSYEVHLSLANAALRPLVLSTRRPELARQLGWNAFLSTGARPVAAAKVAYLLRASLEPAQHSPGGRSL